MKTLGLIGGIGPESTIDYYRALVEVYQARSPDGAYPPLIINSVDNRKLIALITANALPEVTRYLLEEIGKLARAGADLGLLSANTPHLVFDDLARESPIPLISIVEATCAAAKTRGFQRLGLFGTRFTMQADFFPRVFAKAGLTLVTPSASEQDYIHEKYMGELFNGVFRPETREGLMAIAERLRKEEKIEALILGGTELPLILRDAEKASLPFLDTTRIHVEAAVDRMLS